jgi:hypothetical protein
MYGQTGSSRYVIRVAPGVYTENLVIPTHQYIVLDLEAALIVGNVTWNVDGAITGASSSQSKLVIRGTDLRSMYEGAGVPLNGIQGTLTIMGLNAALSSHTPTVHLNNVGVSGAVTFDSTSAAGAYLGQLFIDDCILEGAIVAGTGVVGMSVTLYAQNCDTSSSKSIGGVSGFVNPYVLRNVRFTGAVVTTNTVLGGRWFDVEFLTASHDLSAASGTINMDANTAHSFLAKVASDKRASITINPLDTADGLGYTVGASGNWSGAAPTTVQSALDRIAAAIAGAHTGVPIA